jgi:hypothetical protein
LQIRFIAALLRSQGLDRACAEVRVTLAEALAERLRDRGFRSEWLAADAERLETAETRYIDHLLGVLADPAGKGLQTLQDKAVLAVWQTLRDGRKRAAGGSVAADGCGPTPETPTTVDDQATIDALIARVAAGLAEAEAALGLPGSAP